MLGRYILTQNDVQDERFKDDSICLGSYNIDSTTSSASSPQRAWEMEGYIIRATDPYEIPYRSIPFRAGKSPRRRRSPSPPPTYRLRHARMEPGLPHDRSGRRHRRPDLALNHVKKPTRTS